MLAYKGNATSPTLRPERLELDLLVLLGKATCSIHAGAELDLLVLLWVLNAIEKVQQCSSEAYADEVGLVSFTRQILQIHL